ncbi:hypothetical protein NL532_15940 [Mesorhizobium sp. C120A]|uniref:hypothetical protein n=1 Tax=Mesorhizobium sp. C120A TaxID=2956824 RepID=UPI0025761895|nr:hypothetical protein [Mesorhizobium sp. C120A]WJI42195.1 hypothetical protein NL532_15940 [Mesorhizobium sp. C120A]
MTTTSFEQGNHKSENGFACQNSAGAYALPKHVLKFDVTYTEADPDPAKGTPARYDIGAVEIVAQPDPTRIYCLDFLASAWAEDKVNIQRDTGPDKRGGLLLEQISTSNHDQTLDIANQIVDAAATVAAAAGTRGAVDVIDKKLVTARFEVDPFDRTQMLRVNAALRDLDYCLFLEPANDPYVPKWENDLCSGYRPQAKKEFPYYGLDIIDRNPPPKSDGIKGVLYKPLLTHKLVTMKRNRDPVGPAWQLFGSQRVTMANAAPAMMLEIKRSAFVTRSMKIKFEDGSLQSVSVSKPSEANALADFVLRTAQVVISIPVRALVIGKTDAENKTMLIAAQAELLATLRAYNAEVEKQAGGNNSDGNASPQRSSSRFASPDADTGYGSVSYDACMRNSVLMHPTNPESFCAGLEASAGQ